jgi:KDO2-lipid IV(A) lauroyltransferase
MGLLVFGTLGKIVWLFPNIEKERTLHHLELIFGNSWSRKKIVRYGQQVYTTIAQNFYDALYLRNATPAQFDAIVNHDSLEPIKEALAFKKGLIVITGHIGCFEMLLPFMARKGFKSFAIGRRSYDDRIDALIRAGRTGSGYEYFHRSENPRLILRNLQEGKVFGVLIDQDTNVEGVFAPFLGKPAYTPSAPIRMAMRFNIPVIVMTTHRLPNTTHHVCIGNPLQLALSGNFDSDLNANVEQVNNLLSAAILKHPGQWVWMHRRWRRTP